MALFPISFPPGIYRNGTEYQSKGRWYDAALTRFYEGTIRPIGGWRTKDRSGALTNPFTTVNTTPTVTVAHNAHGLRVGDRVRYSSGAAVGGLTMTGVNWTVATVPGANTYTFTHTSNATSTVGVGAGGAVSYAYTQAASGKARAILTWKDNTLTTWIGIGTQSKLYVMNRAAQLFDITPVGFVAGIADALSGGGYGAGSYGVGTYGTPRTDSTAVQDATVWSTDTWGQDLVGCTVDDGKIYEWALNTAVVAAQVTNSPTARAVFTTEDDFQVALGASGLRNRVKWSDQRNNTVWTAAATNQAGDFDLQTPGKLMLGKRVRGGSLLLTDLDAHLMVNVGGTLIFGFRKLAESCGAISQNCAAVPDTRCVWMGRDGFWLYNGFVQPLLCDVAGYVFSSLNALQASKVSCFINSAYSEVTWNYPSGQSNENDRYVTWSYRENHWTIGPIVRLAGADKGVIAYPLETGNDGFTYEHEIGFSYDGATGPPYLESGPFELGNGDNVMYAKQLIPDEKTTGDVSIYFITKLFPNGPTLFAQSYSLTASTDVRFCGRQAKVRYTSARLNDWRVGTPRFDLVAGGSR